jgi:hypothetical protein
MTSSSDSPTAPTVEDIQLIEHDGGRYFVNTTPAHIDRLQYVTVTFGPNYASSVPTFELMDIPTGSAVRIEDVDPYEDGTIVWQIAEVDWSDGTIYEGTEKRMNLPRRWRENWSIVEREKTMIGEPDAPQRFDEK